MTFIKVMFYSYQFRMAFDIKSRDSSVGIATGYGQACRRIGVPISAGTRDFSLLHSAQTDSGAHPASYPEGTGDCFPGGEAGHSH
jgi:hypothetical protein